MAFLSIFLQLSLNYQYGCLICPKLKLKDIQVNLLNLQYHHHQFYFFLIEHFEPSLKCLTLKFLIFDYHSDSN